MAVNHEYAKWDTLGCSRFNSLALVLSPFLLCLLHSAWNPHLPCIWDSRRVSHLLFTSW